MPHALLQHVLAVLLEPGLRRLDPGCRTAFSPAPKACGPEIEMPRWATSLRPPDNPAPRAARIPTARRRQSAVQGRNFPSRERVLSAPP